MTTTSHNPEAYRKYIQIVALLGQASVPEEHRTMRISYESFIELGGTDEQWQRIKEPDAV